MDLIREGGLGGGGGGGGLGRAFPVKLTQKLSNIVIAKKYTDVAYYGET